MFKIVLAEDETNLRKLIKKNLELRGYEVTDCENGFTALQAFEKGAFDLLITDIMMPQMDGDTLVSKIKQQKADFPIIMLTALDAISAKQKSFSGGADDYLTKPVDYAELDLRINALLRRCQLFSKNNIVHKEVKIDFEKKSLSIVGKDVDLTKKEFLLLYMLCSSPNRIYSREQILNEIWGLDSESFERTVDVHINKLRNKTENTSLDITTVRGLGYKAVFK